MGKLIAMVDDEPDIVELVSLHLKKEHFSVKEFFRADSFFMFLNRQTPDLIILDLMLPDMNGIDICKQLNK
jgi:DNA-binding response OmpR family regulator